MKILSLVAVLFATAALAATGCAAPAGGDEAETGTSAQALEADGATTISTSPDDGTAQTREHILLARQVGVVAADPAATTSETRTETGEDATREGTNLTAPADDETEEARGTSWDQGTLKKI